MKIKLTLFWLGCLFASQLFATELGLVSAEQLMDMQKNSNALVIDVRTPAEWQATGVISASQKLQSFDSNGNFDEDAWVANLTKLKSSPDQPVILVCRSGNRSAKVGQILTEKLGMTNVYHLSNGIQSWIKAGHPVKADCVTTACN